MLSTLFSPGVCLSTPTRYTLIFQDLVDHMSGGHPDLEELESSLEKVNVGCLCQLCVIGIMCVCVYVCVLCV
jgi:hypothetical protein